MLSQCVVGWMMLCWTFFSFFGGDVLLVCDLGERVLDLSCSKIVMDVLL